MLNNRRGFSLVEIMIVLIIIGLIASTLGTSLFGAADKSRVKAAKLQIQRIADTLETYNGDCLTYPSTDQGLEALIDKPEGEPSCENWGPESYLKKLPKDPWGRPYEYESDGTEFSISSTGKDKKPGGEGYAADISSKDL